jgi:hypothetical protein
LLTQGVKSPTLLLILLFAVLVIDILAMFKLRDMYSDYRKRIPLFANLLIPLGAYLAFTDQQDEMYIWASKIDNLILSGRLGVELHDTVLPNSTFHHY